MDFSGLFLNLSSTHYDTLAAAKAAGAPTVNYGTFLNAVIDFLIVAFVILLVVQQVNRLNKAPAPAPPNTKECPYCKTSIPLGAVRCPNCISHLKAARKRSVCDSGSDEGWSMASRATSG